MYAIIEDSGTQFKVTTGDTLDVDRKVEEGTETITFDRVLLIGGEGEPRIGEPVIAGATVTAEVIREFKDKKVLIMKYIRRKGFHKKVGHRQTYTKVRVTAING